jgi:hypothetical protein
MLHDDCLLCKIHIFPFQSTNLTDSHSGTESQQYTYILWSGLFQQVTHQYTLMI